MIVRLPQRCVLIFSQYGVFEIFSSTTQIWPVAGVWKRTINAKKRTKRGARNKNKTKRIGSTPEKRPKQRTYFGVHFLDKKRFNSPRHIYTSLSFCFRQSLNTLSGWIKLFLDHYRYENNMIAFSAHCWKWTCFAFLSYQSWYNLSCQSVLFRVTLMLFFFHAGVRHCGTFNVGPWEAPETVQYTCTTKQSSQVLLRSCWSCRSCSMCLGLFCSLFAKTRVESLRCGWNILEACLNILRTVQYCARVPVFLRKRVT